MAGLLVGAVKRDRKRKPGFLFVCLHHIHFVFDSESVPFSATTNIFVCEHMDTQIAYLPRFGWLRWLVLGTKPDCPSANTTRPKRTLSTSWNREIHTNTKLRGTMLLGTCQCSPGTLLTHRVFCVHMAHFSIGRVINLTRRWKISLTFLQQCLCLINDSFGEKCDQGHARSIYFKRSLTHPGTGSVPVGLYSPLHWAMLKSPVQLSVC